MGFNLSNKKEILLLLTRYDEYLKEPREKLIIINMKQYFTEDFTMNEQLGVGHELYQEEEQLEEANLPINRNEGYRKYIESIQRNEAYKEWSKSRLTVE